jgi:hypothetical protein
MTRREHFVVFDSPGSLFSESSYKPIAAWDIAEAVRMSRDIVERHGARPYGFRFETRIVADQIPDGEGVTLQVMPRAVAKSGVHFLGGGVHSLDEVPDNETNHILRSNMEGNGWWYVVVGVSRYRWTQPFEADSVIVDPATGEVIERGDRPDRVEYRAKKDAEREAKYAAMRGADKPALTTA